MVANDSRAILKWGRRGRGGGLLFDHQNHPAQHPFWKALEGKIPSQGQRATAPYQLVLDVLVALRQELFRSLQDAVFGGDLS